MYNWRDIVRVYDDVLDDQVNESDFIIDLEDAISGNSTEKYSDSNEFFLRTFLTSSLKSLLEKISKKLILGKGSSIFSIRTPFGGGKTHTLLTIYHFLKQPKLLNEYILKIEKPEGIKLGTIVGTHLNPLIGQNSNRIQIKTIWGEIAYRLAGDEGFEIFKENDWNQISPGKTIISKFLEKQQPFIILIDEILEYLTKAQGVAIVNSDLGSQTLAFIQELVESISLIPKGILVITLPYHEEEVFSKESLAMLKRVTKLLGRIESIHTPISKSEIFFIIQNRFFKILDKNGQKKDNLNKIMDFISQLPFQTENKSKPENMLSYQLSFPFHPEIISVLYSQWGSLGSFQQIRGILRFIHYFLQDLYMNKKVGYLILPSDINYDNPILREELLKHLDPIYRDIVNTDILELSNKIDSSKYREEPYIKMFRDIAATIFFYSFSSKPLNGITNKHLANILMIKNYNYKSVIESLEFLKERLWYLNKNDDRFFFLNRANINKIILDLKKQFESESLNVLRDMVADFIGDELIGVVWPQTSKDIPDNQFPKLILMQPKIALKTAYTWMGKNQSPFRLYKNTLILVSPNIPEFIKCKILVQEYLALKFLKDDYKTTQISSKPFDVKMLERRIVSVNKDIKFQIASMYSSASIGERIIDLGFPPHTITTLSGWYKNKLLEKEILVDFLHPRVILIKFLKKNNNFRTKDILNYFLKSTNEIMLTSPKVLKKTLQKGVEEGIFGLTYFDEDKETFKEPIINKMVNLSHFSFSDFEYIVTLDSYSKKIDQISIKPSQKGNNYVFNYSLQTENIDAKYIKQIQKSIIDPLVSEGQEVKMNIEFQITSKKGIDKKKLNAKVKETLTQIGIDFKIKESK